jgi:Kyakuja-Dileera-Zisupton transposase
LKRVAASNHLDIPDIDIIAAVGKFHLGAHAEKCFCRYSLNFIHGAGQHDGEIIETLWPGVNDISPSIRLMSKASRREMLDDAMRYSNFKKLVGMSELIQIQSESHFDNSQLQQNHC